jgi:hypothetical protein
MALRIALLVSTSSLVAFGDTIPIPGNYGTTASGDQLIYTLVTNLSGGILYVNLQGNPAVYSSPTLPAYTGYATLVPSGQAILGATLDVDVELGSPYPTVINSTVRGASAPPFFTPGLIGTLNAFSVVIQSGPVMYQATSTSFSVDLFAAGFGSQIQAGAPILITFNITETVAHDSSAYQNNVPYSQEVLTMLDNRNIILVGNNYLTLETQAIPEPFTLVLVGTGLVLFGGLRVRQRPKKRL